MSQDQLTPARGFLAAIVATMRLRPLQLLVPCALLAAAGPAWKMTRIAANGVVGGVRVDTSGASGTIENGRYRLDLPVLIANGSSNVVFGVSLWVEAFACPSERSPATACRRFASFEQYVPGRIMPGSAQTANDTVAGSVAVDADQTVVRIYRKLQAVSEEPPSADAGV